MIQELVNRFMVRKEELRQIFKQKHPEDYTELVKAVVEIITDEDDYGECNLDPDRIYVIDDGDCQGTLVYIIAEKGCQPSDYWYVKVDYGSCSGCDTLKAIRGWGDEGTDEQQVNDYITLALHIVQRIKVMSEDIVC